MKSEFSIERVANIILCDLQNHKGKLILFSAATIMFSILLNFYQWWITLYMTNYTITGRVAILFMVVAASFSFYELDFPDKEIFFLTTPASTLEKYLARVITTLFGYFLIIIAAKYITYLVIKLILGNKLFYLKKMVLGDDFDLFKEYLFGYSIYFFGSVFFKKNEFIKTALILATVIILILVLSGNELQRKIANLIFGNNINNVEFNSLIVKRKYPELVALCSNIFDTVYIIFRYISVPFLLILGYFRLKEEEVTDGLQ